MDPKERLLLVGVGRARECCASARVFGYPFAAAKLRKLRTLELRFDENRRHIVRLYFRIRNFISYEQFWAYARRTGGWIRFCERHAMSRLSARFYIPVLFAFLLASSAMAQKSGSSGSGSSGSGSTGSKGSGSSTTTQPGSSPSTGQPPASHQPQFQSPLY